MPFVRTLRILMYALIALRTVGTLSAQTLNSATLVGDVTDHGAVVGVWLAGPGTIRLVYGTTTDALDAPGPIRIAAGAADDYAVKVPLTDLLPATRYYYRVQTDAGVPIGPIQSFTTFPTEGRDAPVTLLFGSCQQSRTTDSGRVFTAASGLDADVFVHLGDWTYPDNRIPGYPATDGSIRASYALRLDAGYAFARSILSRMGLAYTWDDHDFAGNNSDGSLADSMRRALLTAYDRYLPHYPFANPGAGLWHSFMVGNVEVFMIDGRSQRSVVDSAFTGSTFSPPAGHSMLAGYPVSGVDQRGWLMNAIRASKARWKIVASPVFFNPGCAPAIPLALLASRKDLAVEFADKWIGFPADIDSMKALFSAGLGRNMLVISGDAHTNVYDDGTHSLIPEFMVGNLDKENSNLNAQLQSYGFNVWTAGQEGTSSTIGRIRVETTPRHRLIVESYDTTGKRLLEYEMVDAGSSSVGTSPVGDLALRSITMRDERIEIVLNGASDTAGSIEVIAHDGRTLLALPADPGHATYSIPAPGLPSGAYVVRVRIGTLLIDGRCIVVR